MVRIDVAFGAEHRIRQASQAAYRRFLKGGQMLVYCSDEARLTAFSKALWAVDKTSFVPHPRWDASMVQLIQSGRLPLAHIFLCTQLDENILTAWRDKTLPWLLNLDVQCPPAYERFERVLEIVSNHPTDRDLARERMLTYKNAGHQLVYYDLSKPLKQR